MCGVVCAVLYMCCALHVRADKTYAITHPRTHHTTCNVNPRLGCSIDFLTVAVLGRGSLVSKVRQIHGEISAAHGFGSGSGRSRGSNSCVTMATANATWCSHGEQELPCREREAKEREHRAQTSPGDLHATWYGAILCIFFPQWFVGMRERACTGVRKGLGAEKTRRKGRSQGTGISRRRDVTTRDGFQRTQRTQMPRGRLSQVA